MQPDRPFDEPWQAQVFALTVHLHEQGLFSWTEWAATLSTQLHRDDADKDGSDYYQRWTAALEQLLTEKAVTDEATVDAMADTWIRAAHATPHGQPIQLANAAKAD